MGYMNFSAMSFCRVGYETTIGNHQTGLKTGLKQKNTWFEWSLGSLLSYPRTVTMFRSHQTIRLRLQIGTILRSQTPFPGQHVTQLVGLESAFHFWWKWNMGKKTSSKVDKYHHGSQKWNQQISPKIDCDILWPCSAWSLWYQIFELQPFPSTRLQCRF